MASCLHLFLAVDSALARKTVPINSKGSREGGEQGKAFARSKRGGREGVCGKERESGVFPFDDEAERREHQAGRGRASRTQKTTLAVKRKEKIQLSKDVVKRRSAKVKN